MSDTAANGSAEEPKGLVLNMQFLRDFSFENPNAPNSLISMQQKQPEINVDMNVRHRPLDGRTYEAVLTIKGEAKNEDMALFVVECDYGAVVTFGTDVPDEQIETLLVVEVPRLIFPYARKIVADGVQDGGFPPLLVNPIDFRLLLAQKQAQAANGEADS